MNINFSPFNFNYMTNAKTPISFRSNIYNGISPDDIRNYLKDNPTATMKDVAQGLNLNITQFQKACMELSFDYKTEKQVVLRELKEEEKQRQTRVLTRQEVEDFCKSGSTSPLKLAKQYDISTIEARKYLREYAPATPNKRQKHYVPPYKIDTEELKKFIESNPELTYEEIAKRYNVSYTTVYSYISKNNISYVPKTHAANFTIKRIQEFIINNPDYTYKDITDNFNIPLEKVEWYLKAALKDL